MLAENKGVPLSASKKVEAETPVDEFEAKDLRSLLHLKVDHSSRPLWVVSPAWSLVTGRSAHSAAMLVLFLLRGPKMGFSPHRGDTLLR